MSREIDLSKKLSDDDRAYLAARGRHIDIARADRAAGVSEGSGDPETPPEGGSAASGDDSGAEVLPEPADFGSDDWFDRATVKELKSALRVRELNVSGKRDELADRLAAFLDAEEEDDDTE